MLKLVRRRGGRKDEVTEAMQEVAGDTVDEPAQQN
jgi:hypothetical protein